MEPERAVWSPETRNVEYSAARGDLVRDVARRSGVTDDRILTAIGTVPRHRFVPQEHRCSAYVDRALPLAAEQTISQPTMIALMLAELEVQHCHRVLEIGAGSGYAAAVLGELAAEVVAVEIVPELSASARARLAELGYRNVTVVGGDGRSGYPARAPYDRILVSAGAESVPSELLAQLVVGGRIVMPIGDDRGQELSIGEKLEDGSVSFHRGVACIFVPLVSS